MVLQLSSRSVSVVVFLVYWIPFYFMWRCPIILFVYFSILLLFNTSVRPIHILRKTFLIDTRRSVFVGINSPALNYCVNCGLVLWARMLFTTGFDCFVIRWTSHFPVCLFLVPFKICFPLFWTVISCWSGVVVHTSSHRTPNNMSGVVLILVEMWVCLAFIVRPGSYSFSTCDNSIVLPYGSIVVMLVTLLLGTLLVWLCLLYGCLHLSLWLIGCSF